MYIFWITDANAIFRPKNEREKSIRFLSRKVISAILAILAAQLRKDGRLRKNVAVAASCSQLQLRRQTQTRADPTVKIGSFCLPFTVLRYYASLFLSLSMSFPLDSTAPTTHSGLLQPDNFHKAYDKRNLRFQKANKRISQKSSLFNMTWE